MREAEIIRMSLLAIRAYFKESLLIILATAAGVFSIGLGQAIFCDTKNKILDKVNAIGKNCIYIFQANNKINSKPITMAEFKTLEKVLTNRFSEIARITPALIYRYTTSSTKSPFTRLSTTINCTKPDFFKITNKTVKKGRMLNDQDFFKKVCVVGSSAEKNFGKTVVFDGLSFAIVGVLEKTAQISQQDPNGEVFIPFGIANVLLNDTKIVHEIIVQVQEEQSIGQVIEAINQCFKSMRKTKKEADQDWSIFDQKSFRTTALATSKLLRQLIIFFSIITMLLCFIACLNSVFLNIKAREKEFAILWKIGAKQNIIFKQIFYELIIKFATGLIIGWPLCMLTTRVMAINLLTNTHSLELTLFYIAIIVSSSLFAGLKSI